MNKAKEIQPKKIAWLVSISVSLIIGLAFLFPKTGIKILGKEWYYVHVDDVLEKNQNRFDVNDLLNQRIEGLTGLQNEVSIDSSSVEFAMYSANADTTRLIFPDTNRMSLDDFFLSLHQLKTEPSQVRIMHFGDSQIEEDRITFIIRKGLQEKFGGSGPGLVSAVPLNTTISAAVSYSNNWARFTSFAMTGLPFASNRYGAMGIVCKYLGTDEFGALFPEQRDSTDILSDSTYSISSNQTARNAYAASLKITPIAKSNSKIASFNQVKLFLGNVNEMLQISCSGHAATETVPSPNDYWSKTFRFSKAPNTVSLSFSGKSPEVYGISLESETGVVMDNIPMRGSDGSVFVKFQQSSARSMYQELNPKLIILQYGGNVLPVIRSEKNVKGYMKQLANSIKTLRAFCPNVQFIFIGPADMTKTYKGKLQTHRQLELLVRELKIMCKENNVTFFDMYAAMGGYNSMIQWVEQGLASPDYIHFNREGAEKIADIFYQNLIAEYKLFLRRKGLKND